MDLLGSIVVKLFLLLLLVLLVLSSGEPETNPKTYPFIARFKNWKRNWGMGTLPCAGKRIRKICIWGVGDLPRLQDQPQLFVNKFHLKYEHLALDCMEELHYNRTRVEILGTRQFDTEYYETLPFVLNHS